MLPRKSNEEYLYHFYDREGTVTIPYAETPEQQETKQVYSLKKDMDALRQLGASKGIVDPSVTSVGKSFMGNDLLAIKMGKGAEHKVLFSGCHHSREWISVEVPYYIAEYLIHNYSEAPTTRQEKIVSKLLQMREVWFVPMVNPDGHIYTTQQNRMWRPGLQTHTYPANYSDEALIYNPNNPYTTEHQKIRWALDNPEPMAFQGVDLNRNYPTLCWGQWTVDSSMNWQTSTDPRMGGPNSKWTGPRPASEPEVKAMVALLAANKFRAGMTFHNYAEEFLYSDFSDDHPFVDRYVAQGLFDLLRSYGHGAQWALCRGAELYPATGDFMDYTWEQTGRPSFLPELRPKSADYGFSYLPESEIEHSFREMLPVALALINCAGFDRHPERLETQGAGSAPNEKRRLNVIRNCWKVFQNWEP